MKPLPIVSPTRFHHHDRPASTPSACLTRASLSLGWSLSMPRVIRRRSVQRDAFAPRSGANFGTGTGWLQNFGEQPGPDTEKKGATG